MPRIIGETKNGTATVVWGKHLEKGDFLRVPHAMIRLHRYHDGLSRLKPRHLMLLLVLASRKFQNKPIRVYWEELADDLGASRETVRKWAYQLKDQHLLRISPVRGRDKDHDKVGYRNDRNVFDIRPFVKIVEIAFAERERQRNLRASRDTQ